MTATGNAATVRLRVAAADSQDIGRATVRIDPRDMLQLGLKTGDVVEVIADSTVVARVMPCKQEDRGKARICIDSLLRDGAGCVVDGYVEVRPAQTAPANTVQLRAKTLKPVERDLDHIAALLDGRPVKAGGILRATLHGNEAVDFDVEKTVPEGPVIIGTKTILQIERSKDEFFSGAPSYEDIGGAHNQMKRIRELIELPLRFPEVFDRLGIDPPKGVLLYGPPGCGKTLIARTIAHETDAKFFTISGPEVIHKFYGESEAHLRKIFQEAAKKAPSIIFLDEIDAIAPRRENAAGDVERRVVAQLLALMDGLKRRENVLVLAATNLPNSIDPALRRPGRFDREIEIPIPNREGRRHILAIHSRGMPLSSDVDLEHLATITHGYVGADIAALCREAAMSCLRKVLDQVDFCHDTLPYQSLASLCVTAADFLTGFQAVQPSALREVFVEVPSVSWEEIGGLHEVKQSLFEALIWPLIHHEAFGRIGLKPPKGLLLVGPPGCGKTTLAKAAATESKVNFISVKGPQLLSKFVGESERAVREIFSKARQASPCILFFDEIDGLCATRRSEQTDAGVANRILSQFLAEMDGIEELSGVLVLAATNRMDVLDPALLRFGRFEQTINIPLPDQKSRREIIAVHVRNKPLASNIDLEDLARTTDGFSGADIASICNDAARRTLRRVLGENPTANKQPTFEIVQQDFDAAISYHKTQNAPR